MGQSCPKGGHVLPPGVGTDVLVLCSGVGGSGDLAPCPQHRLSWRKERTGSLAHLPSPTPVCAPKISKEFAIDPHPLDNRDAARFGRGHSVLQSCILPGER